MTNLREIYFKLCLSGKQVVKTSIRENCFRLLTETDRFLCIFKNSQIGFMYSLHNLP